MLGVSGRRAKVYRLQLVADTITAILVAFRNDPAPREEFRRRCLVALSNEPTPDHTPELELWAEQADLAEDARQTAYLLAPTPTNLEALIRAEERAIGLAQDRLRALRAKRDGAA